MLKLILICIGSILIKKIFIVFGNRFDFVIARCSFCRLLQCVVPTHIFQFLKDDDFLLKMETRLYSWIT